MGETVVYLVLILHTVGTRNKPFFRTPLTKATMAFDAEDAKIVATKNKLILSFALLP